MPYTTLVLDDEGEFATVTLNRPEKRNALSPAMVEELVAALQEAASSRGRAVILTGAGKAFCAGMDLEALNAFSAQSPDQINADARRIAQMFRRIYSFPKPLIAAVNGAAIAGGCGIATLADFTLAVPAAKFGYTEVRIGFMPAIVSVFLIRQVGEKRARDLLLSGRVFDTEEAHRMGLVNEVVPEKKLLERARELAASLAAMSPTSLVYTKRLLCQLADSRLEAEVEDAIEESARIRSTPDFQEGISAFLEKRKPRWRGV